MGCTTVVMQCSNWESQTPQFRKLILDHHLNCQRVVHGESSCCSSYIGTFSYCVRLNGELEHPAIATYNHCKRSVLWIFIQLYAKPHQLIFRFYCWPQWTFTEPWSSISYEVSYYSLSSQYLVVKHTEQGKMFGKCLVLRFPLKVVQYVTDLKQIRNRDCTKTLCMK